MNSTMEVSEVNGSMNWDTLWQTYNRDIYYYLLRLTKNTYDAEDMLQDTFLKGYLFLQKRHLKRECIYPLFRTIARNIVVDHYRKNNQRHLAIHELMDRNDPENICLHRIEVSELLNRLNVLQKNVIICRVLYGYSIKETAALLKKTEMSIRLLQHRGMKRLSKEAVT